MPQQKAKPPLVASPQDTSIYFKCAKKNI